MLVKHTTLNARERPTAYTLVELLVVMAIIGFLAALLMVMWPGLNSSTQSTRNADRVQGMLLSAKMMAIRDGVPTGVRFMPDPNNPNNITQLIYIRQPNPFVPPVTTVNGTTTVGTLAGSKQGTSVEVFFNYVDFTGGFNQQSDYVVQPGDYLEINGGGPLYQVSADPPPQSDLFFTTSIFVANATTNWRLIRQPRPVVGEEPLQLTGTIVIDASGQYSQNIPTRSVAGGLTYYEIMFAPSGSVINYGQGGAASNDKIILWVYDRSQATPTANSPVLIGVQVGTGLIGGYPVDINQVGGDYYTNTRDPHASGM